MLLINKGLLGIIIKKKFDFNKGLYLYQIMNQNINLNEIIINDLNELILLIINKEMLFGI